MMNSPRIRFAATLILLLALTWRCVPAQAQSLDPSGFEIQIGGKMWMSVNLSVGVFSNGDSIPHMTTDEEWMKACKNGQPAWCYYDNDPADEARYGRLYNWFAASDPRGLCPSGWHVPSDKEWTDLENAVGGRSVAGGKLKAAGNGIWKAPNTGATDEVRFAAMPAGFRRADAKRYFGDAGSYTVWWSSRQKTLSVLVFTRAIMHDKAKVIRGMAHQNSGVSVRCIKGAPEPVPDEEDEN